MSITSTTPEHVSSSTLRVRRYRERRRKGVRCLTVEMYEADIAEAATRSLLRSDGDAWNVLDAWYASHLSEAALQWLVDNRVIVILLLLGRARMLRPDAFPKINIGPAHAHDFTGTCPVINNSRMMFADLLGRDTPPAPRPPAATRPPSHIRMAATLVSECIGTPA